MISSKILSAVIFLYSVKMCAMGTNTQPASQKLWEKAAREAIKDNLATDLEQAMRHIMDQKVKKHLFRKVAREKPNHLLLLEAVIASGLELQSRDAEEKETVVEFVKRKNILAHVSLVKKYLTLKELDGQTTPQSSPKLVSLKESAVTIASDVVDNPTKKSCKDLALSKSGKISRRSLKNGNPVIHLH